jgi:HEAT repeat protein
LAWVATPDDITKVVELIEKYGSGEPKDEFRRTCLLGTLLTRPNSRVVPPLLRLIQSTTSTYVRHQAARAIGRAGVDEGTEAKLFELMRDPQVRSDAALALLLGGTASTAARAMAALGEQRTVLEQLQELWYKSFGYWSQEDLDQGRIFRWVENADAVARIELSDAPQKWALALLERRFRDPDSDAPHSLTRVVLRHELVQMAKSTDAAKREGALRVLQLMNERGVLLALQDAVGKAVPAAPAAGHDG